MRETALLHAVVSGIFCGLLFWVGVLWTHGTSYGGWHAFDLLPVAGVLSGPLVLLAWSVIAVPRWRSRGLAWTRQIIRCHGVLGLVVLLAGCSHYLPVPNLGGYAQEDIGLVGLLTTLIDLVLLGLILKPASDPEMLRIYRKSVLLVAGGALLAVALWPFAVIGLVTAQAELIAGGRPYCIEVPNKQFGERGGDPLSLFDLNGLKMHTDDEAAFGEWFDAALVVQAEDGRREWWNWSYALEHFRSIDDATVKLFNFRPECTLQPHFVRHLPVLPPG
jgi:hypothetical protein